MSAGIVPIFIPKQTVSDDFYIVVKLFYSDGDKVRKGDIIFIVETSKAVIEIESPSTGYIYYNIEEGLEIAVDEICAAVSISLHIPNDYFSRFITEDEKLVEENLTADDSKDIRISNAAKQMLKEHNVDISVFKGKTILRTEDIYEYLKSTTANVRTFEIVNTEFRNKVIIIGGGGYAKVCIDIIRQMRVYNLAGIVDSGLETGATTLDVPVIGGEKELEDLYKKGIKYAVIGFGMLRKPIIREELYHQLKDIGYLLPNLIHPSAILEPSVTLGEGNQILAGAIVGSDVKIENNCIINSGSIISHDSILHNNAHITPGAILAGTVEVGNNTIIGMGATVFLGVKIGSNVIVPNGMNIIKDIPDGMVLKGKM